MRNGEVGEITVAGPTATDSYFNREAQTRLAKIRERLPDGSERIVHRMGDLGWIDGDGRLWFCGRKTHRVIVDAATTPWGVQGKAVLGALLTREQALGSETAREVFDYVDEILIHDPRVERFVRTGEGVPVEREDRA